LFCRHVFGKKRRPIRRQVVVDQVVVAVEFSLTCEIVVLSAGYVVVAAFQKAVLMLAELVLAMREVGLKKVVVGLTLRMVTAKKPGQ
jgi:hypothetical protein